MALDVDAGEVERLRAAREAVLERIAAACERVRRDASEVTLVAVSKTVPVGRLRAAVAAGLNILGENRVQEAEDKVGAVEGATWHLVGPLQSNKARRAIGTFDVIESIDSIELARRLDRIAGDEARPERLPVLVQVNVDDDPTKAGFGPATVEAALGDLAGLNRLDVRGLMTIGRQVDRPEDARSTFRSLRELSDRLRRGRTGLGTELSMGMSADFEIAVEEGATIVRVGQAIFGERPHTHEGTAPHVHAAAPGAT